jgi:nucleotide-binding universal stress UspA family protein
MNRIAKLKVAPSRTGVADGLTGETKGLLPAGAGAPARLFQWKFILVPVDYRESSGTALHCAAELAATSGAKLIVLHVLNLGRGMLYDGEGRRITLGERRQLAHRELAQWVKAARLSKDVQAEPLIRWGERVDEMIIATAQRWKVDLIVMAGHARPFWERLFDVKTTSRVVRYSPCDVYYVCHNAKLPRPAKASRRTAKVK